MSSSGTNGRMYIGSFNSNTKEILGWYQINTGSLLSD